MGRPKKQVNAALVEELASIGCTEDEIASACDCSVSTLDRRFADVIRKGRDSAKSSIRRLQFKSANAGNVTMQIWLGKQYLGQADVSRVNLRNLSEMSDEELAALVAGKAIGK